MRKNIIGLLLCIFLILPSSIYAGEINQNGIEAAILAEYETGDVIYSYNADARIEVASITKIMTYLVAMDEISKGNKSLDDEVVISEKAAKRGGSSFKLKEGQVYTLEKLLESALIASANDGCIAIAQHVSGSEEAFIKLMNKKAQELELEKSYFVSVSGYPEEGIHNTMTANDILKLTTFTIEAYPQVLDITSKKVLVDEERGFEFINTNPILGEVSGVNGFKTGYADVAGYCLVSTQDKDNKKMIGIIMGAESQQLRKERSIELLEGNIAKDFKKEKILNKNSPVKTVNIEDSANKRVEVYPKDDLFAMLTGEEHVDVTTNVYNYLDYPIEPGETIGEIIVKYNEKTKKVDLIAKEELKENGILNVAILTIRNFIASFF